MAQQVGLSLGEIREGVAAAAPYADQGGLGAPAVGVGPLLDARIAMLERLRDQLDGCIGRGFRSLRLCRLRNSGDVAAARGPGPRWVLGTNGAVSSRLG